MMVHSVFVRPLLISLALFWIAGCAPKIEWYQTEINNPRDALLSDVKQGEKERDIVKRLGIPEFQADLTQSRKLVRYYSDKLELEKREFGESLTERSRYLTEIWYQNGKVVRVRQQADQFINPKGRSKPFDNLTNEDYYLLHPYLSPQFNRGLPFDFSDAEAIQKGTDLPSLLWQLGLPNRIVNTANGELFVYEYGFFNSDFDASQNKRVFRDYNFRKAFFVVRDAEVQQSQTYSMSYDLSGVLEEDNQSGFELSRAISVQMDSMAWLEYCVEHTQHANGCDPNVFQIAENYPELKQLLYHSGDLDFGDIKARKREVFQNLLKSIENNKDDPAIDLLFIYRSSIPSNMIVGKSSLKSVLGSPRLQPYYNKLNGPQGELARTWLNLGQPDKWYFDKQGSLQAAVHFSLISPVSPWYAFGPSNLSISVDPIKGAACTIFSSNCLKPLQQLYEDNIAVPEL